MRLCVFDQSSTVIPLKLFNGQITPLFVSVGRWLSGRGWWRWRCWTGEWGPPRVAMRWVGSLMGPAGVICPGLAKLPRTTGVTMTREKFTRVSLTFTYGEQVFGMKNLWSSVQRDLDCMIVTRRSGVFVGSYVLSPGALLESCSCPQSPSSYHPFIFHLDQPLFILSSFYLFLQIFWHTYKQVDKKFGIDKGNLILTSLKNMST